MTHTLHRYGTKENLKEDYVFYIRGLKVEDCHSQLLKSAEILHSEKPVNSRFMVREKNFTDGSKIKDFTKYLKKNRGYACAFSSREKTINVLKKLKNADLGLSVVVSGLIDEILKMLSDIDLQPHTANISLGIHGKKKHLLPKDQILEITTMCGHGLVGSKLAEVVFEKVKSGKMRYKEGSELLARQCPCGIFNLDRCRELFEADK